MKIEFEFYDRNGVSLDVGDHVKWFCPSIPEDQCRTDNGIYKMYNSGEIITGRIIFDYQNIQFIFQSDDKNINWLLILEKPGKRHDRLEKYMPM